MPAIRIFHNKIHLALIAIPVMKNLLVTATIHQAGKLVINKAPYQLARAIPIIYHLVLIPFEQGRQQTGIAHKTLRAPGGTHLFSTSCSTFSPLGTMLSSVHFEIAELYYG